MARRVELKRERYELRDVGVDECKADVRMSVENELGSMDLYERVAVVLRGGLEWLGSIIDECIA